MSTEKLRRPRRVTDEPNTTPAPDPALPEGAVPLLGKSAARATAVTLATPFRSIGDASRPAWESMLPRQSPLRDELSAILRAASPHGALALVQAIKESSGGTAANAVATKNPLGLMQANGATLKSFASWADAFAEFSARLSNPSYAGGVYQPDDLSLEGYLVTYVGGPSCLSSRGRTCANGETWIPGGASPAGSINLYLAQTIDRLNTALTGHGTPVEPAPAVPASYNFGPHPLPSGITINPATKRPGSSGRGWRLVDAPRGPRLRVVFWHHTAGGPGFTKDECHALFSIGGQREYEALTEAVIDRDGTGYILNDPWSTDPMDGSGRSPFASGPYAKSGSLLAPFVQRFGGDAINELGWATEHCHAEGEAWGDELLDGSARLHGWVITRMQIPWDQWPRNPRMDGIWASYDHDDAAYTTCPNIPADVRSALVDAVRREAKTLQTGSATSPGPVEVTPAPAAWPFDFSRDEVAAFWGAAGGLKRRLDDGTVHTYPFDPTGPIGAIWMARARNDGVFPAALQWWADPSGWNFVTFGSSGDVDWVLGLPSVTGRADWRWVDRPAQNTAP